MPIIDKKKALKSIRETTQVVRGKTYTLFKVDLGTTTATRERVRISRGDRFSLVQAIEEFYRNYSRAGDAFLALKPAEAYDARDALDILRGAGLDATLRDAAKALVASRQKDGKTVRRTLEDAFAEYLGGIPEIQEAHRKNVEWRVGKWVAKFGPRRPCTEVTAREFAEYMAQFDAPKTYNNVLSYCKTFMGWCAAKERLYAPENPLSDMRLKPIAYHEPEFMRPQEVEKLMREFEAVGDRKALALMALSFFCGIRFAEIDRLTQNPEWVNLEGGSIRMAMPKGWTKGMAPRVVPMQDNVRAWFARYSLLDALDGMSAPETRNRVFATAKGLRIDMPKNAGRHTFITMHVAAFNNATVTETICGTSKAMRAAHYMGLASKADGEAYFRIMPKGVDGAVGMCENGAVAGEGKPDPVLN